MTLLMTILFWASLLLLCYTYVGYGLLLALTRPRQRSRMTPDREEFWPALTVLIPAYNEAGCLAAKIRNCLALDYPPGRCQVLVITDGSDDETPRLMEDFPQVTWLHQPVRGGKYAALQRAMSRVDTPLVVFTDANTLLPPDALRHLVPPFRNPLTGGVAGEKKIRTGVDVSPAGAAEGWYWRYESQMKKWEAGWHTVLGAAGELLALRTRLFPALPGSVVLDDFLISLELNLAGYRIAYAPRACATEPPSVSLSEERKRKVRIAAGAFQAMNWLFRDKRLWRQPRIAFQFISRRVFRWVFAPLALIILLLSSGWLALSGNGWVYSLLFYLQLAFYLLALLGTLAVRLRLRPGWLYLPAYFVFMHTCQLQGMIRYRTRGQSTRWEKAVREAL